MQPVFYGPIHWYGLMLAIAFASSTIFAYYEAKRQGINPDKILDLAIWIIISAIIGARLLHVLSNLNYYFEQPIRIIFSRTGFSLYGGFILALITGFWFLYRNKLPIWKIADIVVTAYVLGEIFGRLGCFMQGCCYGKAANPDYILWAMKFPFIEGLAIENPIYRHPTQIYQSIFAFLLFVLLLSLQRRKKFDGEIFWIFLILYSGLRFITDLFREPGQDLTIMLFTLAQIISILIFAFAIGILIRFKTLSIHHRDK